MHKDISKLSNSWEPISSQLLDLMKLASSPTLELQDNMQVCSQLLSILKAMVKLTEISVWFPNQLMELTQLALS